MIVQSHLGEQHPVETLCAAEAIHMPGSIQPHGMLLVADPARGMALVAASANAEALRAGADVLGGTLADVLGAEFAAGLCQRATAGGLAPSAPWETCVVTAGGTFDVVSHAHAGLVLIEVEAAEAADAGVAMDATRRLQRAIAQLREDGAGLEGLAAALVRNMRELTGYERVLVYRFDPDWHGQALAEAMTPEWDAPLLGLRFPASDIPSQARALYRTSLMRWVPSRDAVPVPLRAAADWGGGAIDLSHVGLRSLSPVHMQYHRNLGVDGTMSISILDGTRLWGLVVCHHRLPHRTSAGQRAAAGALTDAFALRIGVAEHGDAEKARQAGLRRFATLIAHMAQADELPLALTTGPVTMRELMDATGAAVVQGSTVAVLGSAPSRRAVSQLADWLRDAAPEGEVFATASLPALYPEWMPQAGVASGVLAVFLSPERTDMLLWFRPEEPTLEAWGGNPHKTPAAAMSPRLSFERWVEERRGSARAWSSHEVEMATMLRHAITEVIVRNLRRISVLNEQLRQSQKMEAVGQLTGGLAHDFNNLLGGITGSLELARVRLAQGRTGELERYLTAALGSAGRAAALTHRLLAFSRRQTLDPKPLDVNRLIASMEDLISRTMGPGIRVDCVASAGLWTTLCDANQLENVLLNLALNARDAMRGGGRLTIEATNTRLDDRYAAQFDIASGQYVAVSVTDTGTGMPPEVASRVFEPFFTTKPVGEGTGLGLSMVYGFTRQSGGHARIYSETGEGTTVRLYLPRHEGSAEAEIVRDEVVAAPGVATVLVVDDEPVLRMLVCEVLEEEGYAVLEAGDGKQALAVIRESVAAGPAIDLLLTDVGLPGGMNGRQVAEAARGYQPGLKVLFITGYAENAALDGGLLDPVTQVMTKPFGMQALIEKIRGMAV